MEIVAMTGGVHGSAFILICFFGTVELSLVHSRGMEAQFQGINTNIFEHLLVPLNPTALLVHVLSITFSISPPSE